MLVEPEFAVLIESSVAKSELANGKGGDRRPGAVTIYRCSARSLADRSRKQCQRLPARQRNLATRSSRQEIRCWSGSCPAYPAATPSFPPETEDSTRAAEYKRDSTRRAASAALPYGCRSC